MTDQEKFTWGVFGWLGILGLSVLVWGASRQDPYAMIRYVLRVLIVVPLIVGLAIAGVRIFDQFTPPVKWLEKVANNEIACAIVLAALILGAFWLGVQG